MDPGRRYPRWGDASCARAPPNLQKSNDPAVLPELWKTSLRVDSFGVVIVLDALSVSESVALK